MSVDLITKQIDAFEIISHDKLKLETNTQIKFSTPNLLINDQPLKNYIEFIIYGSYIDGTTPSDISDISAIRADISNSVNVTEIGQSSSEMEVTNVYCSNISTNSSHIDNSGTNQYHDITFSANQIYLTNNNGRTNIEYNDTSLSNYIYNVINDTQRSLSTILPETPTQTQQGLLINNLTNFGTIYTNKLYTENIYTTKNYTIQSGDVRKEPVFQIESGGKINLKITGDDVGDNIILGSGPGPDQGITLKNYIFQFLDETDTFDIEINVNIDSNITFNIKKFTSTHKDAAGAFYFTYTLKFDLLSGETLTSSFSIDDVNVPIDDDDDDDDATIYDFTSTQVGNYYKLRITITNNKTNTIVEKEIIPTNLVDLYDTSIYDTSIIQSSGLIPCIAPINIINITMISDVEINIEFEPHDIGVGNVTDTIAFDIKLEDIDSVSFPYVSTGYVSTGITQKLSLNTSGNYNYSFTPPTDGSSHFYFRDQNFIKKQKHIFSIRNSYNQVVTGEIDVSDSTIPTPTPSNLRISKNVDNYELVWDIIVDNFTTIIKYDVIYNDVILHSRISEKIGRIGISVNVGTYKIKAYNVWEEEDKVSESDVLVVTQPSISITSISTNSDSTTFTVNYTISNTNGNFEILDTSSHLTSTITDNLKSGYYSLSGVNFTGDNTYTITINLIDSYGITATNTYDLVVKQPSIDISITSIILLGDTTFTVNYGVSNTNGDFQIQILDTSLYPNTTTINYSHEITSGSYIISYIITSGESITINLIDSYGITATDSYTHT
jgi:hypothetical protein